MRQEHLSKQGWCCSANDTFISNTANASDDNDSDEDYFTENLESDPINHRLIKMDSTAEQSAKLYPRCKWAEDYLKSLEHGDSNVQFTPAIYIESNNVSVIKFGSRTSPRAKSKSITDQRFANIE